MSEGMQELYEQHYPDLLCTPLVHSFNEPPSDHVVLPAIHQPLRLALSGNFNSTNTDATSRLAQAIKELPEAHLTLYTSTARSELEQIGLAGQQFTTTIVSRDTLLKELEKSDILLLPHGFYGSTVDEEIRTIFPTRTIEYLISGRPILAHLPTSTFLYKFLHKHNCALLVTEPDIGAIKIAINRLQNEKALRERLVRNALRTAKQFQSPVVAEHLRQTLLTEISHYETAIEPVA
jgi:glycosyltransferase involved in cell wall biosynthesis